MGPFQKSREADPKQLGSHFSFGSNWASYARGISEAQIQQARTNLQLLLGSDSLKGLRFLDIGSGSGVHSLAALELGAAEVFAVDLDPESVRTTQDLLSRHAPAGRWKVGVESVFHLSPKSLGFFDVVYSWGVLHHTGDLHLALRQATRMVARNGLLAIALYRKTWLCPLWSWEKKWYVKASPYRQRMAREIYTVFYRAALALKGRTLGQAVRDYGKNRGMEFYHDLHDWLGGYPYESITSSGLDRILRSLGFVPTTVRAKRGFLGGRELGIFGSGCDEYVYRHTSPKSDS